MVSRQRGQHARDRAAGACLSGSAQAGSDRSVSGRSPLSQRGTLGTGHPRVASSAEHAPASHDDLVQPAPVSAGDPLPRRAVARDPAGARGKGPRAVLRDHDKGDRQPGTRPQPVTAPNATMRRQRQPASRSHSPRWHAGARNWPAGPRASKRPSRSPGRVLALPSQRSVGIIIRVSGVPVAPPASRSTAEFRSAEPVHAESPPRVQTPTNPRERLGVSDSCPLAMSPGGEFTEGRARPLGGEMAEDEPIRTPAAGSPSGAGTVRIDRAVTGIHKLN